jgi:Mg2+-importing ATPase
MGTSSNFGNMLSMALGSVALPFLPLLAPQILLNNLLYDLSEIGIPFDRVEAAEVTKPQRWNFAAITRFTVIMGTLSTLFDLATFTVLLKIFHAGPQQFRTAWFLESMATQILVIFLIRTMAPLYRAKPSRVLLISSVGTLLVAFAIALSPLGRLIDFVPLPVGMLVTIVALTAGYLFSVEIVKSRANKLIS